MKNILLLQGLAIILVVLGHSFPSQPFPTIYSWIHEYIYSFHMPLFMAVSGFLFSYTGGINGNRFIFIKKKARRLLIPYFVISSLAFCPKAMLSNYANRSVNFSLSGYINSLVYPGTNPVGMLWFLPTLFIIFLLATFITKYKSKVSTIITTTVLIFVHIVNPINETIIIYLHHAIKYLIYFWIGCLIARNWYYLEKYFNNKLYLFSLLLITIILNTIHLEFILLPFIIALMGIAMSFCLCQQIYMLRGMCWIEFIGDCSYQIYLFSWFPQVFIRIVFYQVLGLGFYLTSLFMFIGGLLIPILIVELINRARFKYKFIFGM